MQMLQIQFPAWAAHANYGWLCLHRRFYTRVNCCCSKLIGYTRGAVTFKGAVTYQILRISHNYRALPERSFKNDDRKREDPHRASETAAQREARLVKRPKLSAYRYTLPASEVEITCGHRSIFVPIAIVTKQNYMWWVGMTGSLCNSRGGWMCANSGMQLAVLCWLICKKKNASGREEL